MPVRHSLLHYFSVGSIVLHPADSQIRIKLGAEARRKKAIAEQPARSVQYEYLKLGFRNREPMWASGFGQPSHYRINIFNIVHHAATGMAKTISDRRSVVVELSVGDSLGNVAAVLAIHLAQDPHHSFLLRPLRIARC